MENHSAKTTEILRQSLNDAIELYAAEKKLGYEADIYKARGKVEAIADTWDEMTSAGLANLREIKVYDKNGDRAEKRGRF